MRECVCTTYMEMLGNGLGRRLAILSVNEVQVMTSLAAAIVTLCCTRMSLSFRHPQQLSPVKRDSLY